MAVWQILLDSLERRPNNCIPRSSAAFGHFGSLPASASRVSIDPIFALALYVKASHRKPRPWLILLSIADLADV
jgi:hypothetical protein